MKSWVVNLNFIIKIILGFLICAIFFELNNKKVYAEGLNENSSNTKSQYSLVLKERGGVQEKINGTEINLNYDSNNNIFYDYDLLSNIIENLLCLNENNVIESKEPKIEYDNGVYVIRKEIYGTRINKKILTDKIIACINNRKNELDLDFMGCYEDPVYQDTSEVVVNAKNKLNKYISTRISYRIGGKNYVLDSNTIKDWIYIGGNFKITILNGKVRNFVDNMADKYSSDLGSNIAVSGGTSGNNHGWIIDRDNETKMIIDNVKNGQSINRNPVYTRTSAYDYLSSVGDTFVEIDMSKQYLWFYKNGYIVAEGNVVTGNLSSIGCKTPAGIYTLNSKQKDTSLVGENYVCPVGFWMPFIANSIGMHDASWRDSFGGDIYKTNGSHGCVNLPYNLAKSIFDNISVGTPVVCYY